MHYFAKGDMMEHKIVFQFKYFNTPLLSTILVDSNGV